MEDFIRDTEIIDSPNARYVVSRFLRASALCLMDSGLPKIVQNLNKAALASLSQRLEQLPRHRMAA